jgi:N-methylhydantoinase A/oxoprolinase/acetone carboxylase beta subunit
MIDLTTIGAGGGSIAGYSPERALTVGPQSAGAEPGPACYGRGGAQTHHSPVNNLTPAAARTVQITRQLNAPSAKSRCRYVSRLERIERCPVEL